MEYTVSFNFSCLNKRSMISRKSGEVNVTTDASPEELKTSDNLIFLIMDDMARKTKQVVLSVDITDIHSQS